MVNVATKVNLNLKGICDEVRIVLGAVAPTPIRAKKAEILLKDNFPSEALLNEASQLASDETKPLSDIRASAEFRKEISKVLVKRTLTLAFERSKNLR